MYILGLGPEDQCSILQLWIKKWWFKMDYNNSDTNKREIVSLYEHKISLSSKCRSWCEIRKFSGAKHGNACG